LQQNSAPVFNVSDITPCEIKYRIYRQILVFGFPTHDDDPSQRLKLVVDTGSELNLIAEYAFDKLKSAIKVGPLTSVYAIEPNQGGLTVVNGTRIATPGFVVDLFIRIRQFTFRLDASIVRGFGRDILLGRPFLARNNITVKEGDLLELRFPIFKSNLSLPNVPAHIKHDRRFQAFHPERKIDGRLTTNSGLSAPFHEAAKSVRLVPKDRL
jgi:hypothetical protein